MLASAGRARQAQAEEAFAALADGSEIGDLLQRAGQLRDEIRQRVDLLNAEMTAAIEGIDLGLPPADVPEATVDGRPVDDVIFSTAWDWTEATKSLRGRKAYVGEVNPRGISAACRRSQNPPPPASRLPTSAATA